MMQRRDFLRQAGLLSTLSALAPAAILARPAAPRLKVGLQLYTLRDYIGKDVNGVLAKVAQAGYTEVETYGYSPQGGFWGLTPAQLRAALRAHGLSTSSGHYDAGSFLREGNAAVLQASIEAAKTCGQAYFVMPYLDEQLRATPADYKPLAAKLNKAGELCRKAGLKLGYHNHDFEFRPGAGGRESLYEVLLRETDPALVDFELDLYWAVRAGQDPLKLLAAHPGRFPLWHVKDMDKTHPERNTEIGAGSIDFRPLFQRAQAAGLRHVFMEQENFAMDAYQSIAQSAAYLSKKLLL